MLGTVRISSKFKRSDSNPITSLPDPFHIYILFSAPFFNFWNKEEEKIYGEENWHRKGTTVRDLHRGFPPNSAAGIDLFLPLPVWISSPPKVPPLQAPAGCLPIKFQAFFDYSSIVLFVSLPQFSCLIAVIWFLLITICGCGCPIDTANISELPFLFCMAIYPLLSTMPPEACLFSA